jgi:hypothetical protein
MDRLSVGLVEVWTVLFADNRGCGYFVDCRPIITYERHAFHKETKGQFSAPENQEINSVSPDFRAGSIDHQLPAHMLIETLKGEGLRPKAYPVNGFTAHPPWSPLP